MRTIERPKNYIRNLSERWQQIGESHVHEKGKSDLSHFVLCTGVRSSRIRTARSLPDSSCGPQTPDGPFVGCGIISKGLLYCLSNKDETREKFGAEQVHIWRRSYDTRPPGGECLKDVVERVEPYYNIRVVSRPRISQSIIHCRF